MKVILKDIEFDDFNMACRAARWLLLRPDKRDAIITVADGFDFYARRNKASITVRSLRTPNTDDRPTGKPEGGPS